MKPVEARLSHAPFSLFELEFACDRGKSRVVRRRHTGPLVLQRPLYPEGDAVCRAIVVHPPGEVAGGDVLQIDCTRAQASMLFETALEPGAAFCGWDLTCLGRLESGESFVSGRLTQRSAVNRAGREMDRPTATQ